jgi:hypothetical protein
MSSTVDLVHSLLIPNILLLGLRLNNNLLLRIIIIIIIIDKLFNNPLLNFLLLTATLSRRSCNLSLSITLGLALSWCGSLLRCTSHIRLADTTERCEFSLQGAFEAVNHDLTSADRFSIGARGVLWGG